jgi:membrane-bound lytic murein transglycosylase MltF
MRRLWLVWLWAALVFASVASAFGQEPPREALRYRDDLIRNARVVWGLSAPIAVFGAQIHQESAWRPDARSKFAGGLAQFTPDTATWIGSAYKDELGNADPFNPSWAMRALVRYDRHLFDRIEAATPCDRWAFTLSGYNGGAGWVRRDQAMAERAGADPDRWWGNVELYSPRAAWAMRENRGYPRRILLTLQPIYLRWGAGVACVLP